MPAGRDAYLMKNIIHDWNDEKSIAILAACRKAMGPAAKLILVEHVVPDRAEDSAESRRIFMEDVQMMVMLDGQERTADQFGTLMKAAGLRLTKVFQTASVFQLIEGVPA